jgi:RNA polymerase sigma factor (sigma-70 family)
VLALKMLTLLAPVGTFRPLTVGHQSGTAGFGDSLRPKVKLVESAVRSEYPGGWRVGGDQSEPDSPYGDRSSSDEVAKLVRAAIDDDQLAWSRIVERFTGLLWSICRSHRLSRADAADVVQLTWLRLLDKLESIHDPARLAGWLATTCRRECLAALRRGKHIQPTADDWFYNDVSRHVEGPEEQSLVSERNACLWRAFRQLSQRCQEVLRVLVVEVEDGPPSYSLAATTLGMPIGSLGPTRARCLAQLRKLLDAEGY